MGFNRLLVVQTEKKEQSDNLLEAFNKDAAMNLYNEDTFSETGSVISHGSSHNSQKSKKSSTSSKLTKKAKNKLNKRNVKQGSPLEEEFLLMVLNDIKELFFSVNNTYEKDLEEFTSILYCYELVDQAKILKDIFNRFKLKVQCTFPLYNVYQQEFMNKNPDFRFIFSNILPQSLNKTKLQDLKNSVNNSGNTGNTN